VGAAQQSRGVGGASQNQSTLGHHLLLDPVPWLVMMALKTMMPCWGQSICPGLLCSS
jgi:hypothetical protein